MQLLIRAGMATAVATDVNLKVAVLQLCEKVIREICDTGPDVTGAPTVGFAGYMYGQWCNHARAAML